METVKIVFDIDTSDVKTSTQDLVALNKATQSEIDTLKRLEAESNANKVAFSQLSKELRTANNELVNAKKQFGDTSKEAQSAQKNVDALTDKMAELKTTIKPVEDSFVSLRTRVKEAKEEAVKAAEKYGEFSKEAQAAKIKAGALADQMGDLNRQVNLLNPEAKAKAFSNLAQGVVGAFSVATGALQAFGVKNKEVEEIAMQLQGALNITQGIASLKGLKESLDDVKVVLGFTTVAQEAMTVANTAEAASATAAATATAGFGTALAATGIGAIVVAIGALVGAMLVLGSATESDEQKQKAFEEQLKNTNQELDHQRDLVTKLSDSISKDAQTQILQAKLRGASEKEIADIRKKSYEQSRALLVDDVAKQKKAFDEASQNSKLKWEDFEKFEKRYYESAGALRDLDYNYQLENLNSQLSLQDKAQQEREKNAAKRKQDLKEQQQEAEQLLKLQDEVRKQLQENTLAQISDPTQRIQQERQFANEEYAIQVERLQKAGATQEQIDLLAAQHTALVIKLNQEEKDNQDKKQKERLDSYKAFIAEMNGISSKAETDPIKKIQEENDAIDAAYAEQYAMAVKNGDDTTAITEAYLKAVEAQQKKLTEVVVSEDEKRKKSGEETAMARYNREKEAMDRTIQATNELMNTLRSIQSAQYNQEIIDAEKQKEQGLLSEEEYQKKLKEIKHRQDVADKNAAIFKATLDFASAMINALKAPPLAVPAQLAFTAAIAGLNLAKIIATPLPKYQKGTLSVPGMDMGKDSVHAMLQPGEAVIPVSTNRAYHPTIKAIYEKKISPSEINNFVMSRTKAGGSSSVTANVDTYALGRVLSKNKGVQIENANLVGKAIAKEIGSRFNARNII